MWLAKDFHVISISFEGVGDGYFASEDRFVQGFVNSVDEMLEYTEPLEEIRTLWSEHKDEVCDIEKLSRHITVFCG